MKILVVGFGGREHAIIKAFKRSGKPLEIFCANGNAGIDEDAECVPIKPEYTGDLLKFAEENGIDLTFVGGETALALGIADEFERRELKIIGASQAAARLESSKAFAKDFMQRNSIPTAKYYVASSPEEAIEVLQNGKFGDENSPVVVKADGLAAGKGVVVATNRAEAEAAIAELSSGDLVSAEAMQKIVLEECLFGREVSLLLFTDGKDFALMPPARDHKRVGEGDTGPNTGGMGVITDDHLLSEGDLKTIIEKIIKPTLNGAKDEGFPVKGILFLGLMMTKDGAKVLEYNVRFGDPETQAILVRLKSSFLDICEAIVDEKLGEIHIEWRDGNSACVVLASEGYPAKPRTGDTISGLGQDTENVTVFHAGTKKDADGNFITAGGRVLGVTAYADNLDDALKDAYNAVSKITFRGMHYRRDIGR